jgi:prepilin-type N-terminal cleavage/methylation domain-containing protein
MSNPSLPRRHGVTLGASGRLGARHGFSFIELLVTIVIAGIIFAAMVPVFASALKKTAGDNLRVTATNIAQDRLEKIRQLPYPEIIANSASPTATPNLYNPSYAGGQFVTTYTPVGSSKVFTISYSVDIQPSYKDVTVTVRWAGSGPNYVTTMDTIVMDPTALSIQSTSNPYPAPSGGYTLIITFKDARQLVSPYLRVQYKIGTTTYTATPTPSNPFPLASKTASVTYNGLPGGTTVPYTVTCYSQYITATAPTFHLLSNGFMKFDTHPGGS